MAPANRANKKVANSLVAVSSAAVLAVYAAGYVRTRSAADRFDLQAADRLKPDTTAAPVAPLASASAAPAPLAAAADKPAAPVAPAKTVRLPSTTLGPGAQDTTTVTTLAPASAPAPSQSATARQALASTSVVPAPDAPIAPPAPIAPVAPIAPDAPAAKSGYKDGTYLGWGHCRHGDIQASVVIVGGRIESARIADCQTRYPCSIIAPLPPQVSQRQTPDVDTISGATQSGDAFYYAVLDALYQAK